MRACPVNRDTIDLLVTAAYISTPAYRSSTPRELAENADRMGQSLWDENYASVSYAIKQHIAAPRYEWQPVAEIVPHADDEQALQIERSRLLLAEVSCHHPGWDQSPARDLVERLGDAIARRFAHRTLVDSPDHLGVKEYEGLHRAAEVWEREIGFRHPLAHDAAAREGSRP